MIFFMEILRKDFLFANMVIGYRVLNMQCCTVCKERENILAAAMGGFSAEFMP